MSLQNTVDAHVQWNIDRRNNHRKLQRSSDDELDLQQYCLSEPNRLYKLRRNKCRELRRFVDQYEEIKLNEITRRASSAASQQQDSRSSVSIASQDNLHSITPGAKLTITLDMTPCLCNHVHAAPSVTTTSDTSATTASPPIIAIAGLAIETSTFSPQRTSHPSQFHPYRGDDICNDKYVSFLGSDTKLRQKADWRGALIGHALPGGVVTRELFDTLTSEICSRLLRIVLDAKKQGRELEGLWFDIHGAMVVEGLNDAEFLLLDRIRKVIGDEVLVSASMDLHGNVSRELAKSCDLLTCYRTAPHVDTKQTKERACWSLLELVERRRNDGKKFRRPFKAWVPVPVLLPGEQTSTRVEPAKRLYEAVPEVEKLDGVIDASVWVGYAWADEPRNRAAVVVTGYDRNAVRKGAEKLAKLFWDVHEEFHFVAKTGTYKECIDAALRSEASQRPYFISDSGDNPTAGGSGDVTWGLTKLLEREEFKHQNGPKVIYASVPGPKAVHTAVKAGVGATVTVTAGAEVDSLHARPITMTGRVHAIKHGDQYAKIEVVLQVGNVYAILTELRKPYHLEKDFRDLDLQPREADIVIVKIGYLEPELYDMAKDWMLALTPGGVDQDLERLGHRHIRRPMWPFDKEFKEEPDLRARIIPAPGELLTEPDE